MTEKTTDSILDRIGRQEGMTVPDGYFDSFTEKMKAALPEQPWEKESEEANILKPRSTWQRIRPYVYMAAMFAGIWLMMNISTLVGTGGDVTVTTSAEGAPTIAELVADDESSYTDYALETVDPVDLYDNLYEAGFEPMTLASL